MRWKKGSPDFLIFLSAILLLSIGIIMVFSASAYSSMLFKDDRYYYLKRQLMWTMVGIPAMYSAMQVDYFRLKKFVNVMLLGTLFLLLLVPVLGIASRGATRSLGVGFLSFQPSEVIKLTMVMYLAKSLSDNLDNIRSFMRGILPPLGVLMVVAMLIMVQPDLGTTIAVAGTSFVLLAAAGARVSHLALLALGGFASVGVLIAMASYRMKRILAFLNPQADPTGIGFQTIQSLLALGSGSLFGMGLGEGRQKLLYIPENHTDFIFAIVGEELGFIGVTVVIFLFFLLLWRGFRVGITAPDAYGCLLAVGLTTMITLQAIINMGVVSGSLPITGITLPLLSYGGSSLVFTLIGIGMLLNISRYAGQK
ncbi:stage V sporulation protein E [Clostridiales bacterium PH28_bin88]|nr:stage V sporulation protein E [Clostridiales bacterium PH28_bin88]